MTEQKKKNKLKGLLAQNNITQEKLAIHLGNNITTVNRKVNNYKKWTVGEALELKKMLGVMYIEDLFF